MISRIRERKTLKGEAEQNLEKVRKFMNLQEARSPYTRAHLTAWISSVIYDHVTPRPVSDRHKNLAFNIREMARGYPRFILQAMKWTKPSYENAKIGLLICDEEIFAIGDHCVVARDFEILDFDKPLEMYNSCCKYMPISPKLCLVSVPREKISALRKRLQQEKKLRTARKNRPKRRPSPSLLLNDARIDKGIRQIGRFLRSLEVGSPISCSRLLGEELNAAQSTFTSNELVISPNSGADSVPGLRQNMRTYAPLIIQGRVVPRPPGPERPPNWIEVITDEALSGRIDTSGMGGSSF